MTDTENKVIEKGKNPFTTLWSSFNDDEGEYREVSGINTCDGCILKTYFRVDEMASESMVEIKGKKIEEYIND